MSEATRQSRKTWQSMDCFPPRLWLAARRLLPRLCEERSDAAIQKNTSKAGLLPAAPLARGRNDGEKKGRNGSEKDAIGRVDNCVLPPRL
jgi:hypothetical protein